MQIPVLVLTTSAMLYLAALLGLLLPAYVALAVAVSAAVLAVLVYPGLRRATLSGRDLAALCAGLVLVAWTRPQVLTGIGWDVVSYGLMKYPEMKHGIIGPYFSYGHVYEFMVSYIDDLLPPVRGLAIGHSLSLVFLTGAVVYFATAMRSVAGLVAGLALLFFDPTGALGYGIAGKNDVMLAACVLLVWARTLERRPITSMDFVVTNALGALAVGIKTSAVLALALPLALYWRDAWGIKPRVLGATAGVWMFFCWQYAANVIVLGTPTHPSLSKIGLALSPLGALVIGTWFIPAPDGFLVHHFIPTLSGVIIGLAALFVIGVVQAAGRHVLAVRASALVLVLLCPFLLPHSPQLRLILPAILLLGMAGAATAERA